MAKSDVATGSYTPMKQGSNQVQSTMMLNKQASMKRQPSIGTSTSTNAATNGAQGALQSLYSYESKGPKAQLGKGIMHAEASFLRNYRPMSTQAGIAAPARLAPQKTMLQYQAPMRIKSSWDV